MRNTMCAAAIVCMLSTALLPPAMAPPAPVVGDDHLPDEVKAGLFGRFGLKVGGIGKGPTKAMGSIVSFDFDAATGAISDYRYDRGAVNATVFDSITVVPPDVYAPRVNGSVFHAQAADSSIEVRQRRFCVAGGSRSNTSRAR